MGHSAKNITGALPLLSYAGSPAEGACELVIITPNAAEKRYTYSCSAGQQTLESTWSFHDTYCSTWYLSSFLKPDLFLPKTGTGTVQEPFHAMSQPGLSLSEDDDT